MRNFLMTAALWLTAFAGQASAETRTLCAYDPAGKTGDYYAILEEYATSAATWGVELEIKAYTDEETAAKDYEAGQCDGVVATGVRLQRFNRFPSTIEAIGGLPDYGLLKQMVRTITSSDAAAAKLKNGKHETVGILPVGAVYLFVSDKDIDTVPELAGKRIATLDYDKPSLTMVDRVGAIIVPADLSSLGPKFNNGDVDACYISAPGYRPFELWRGLDRSGGGIVKAPLAQATLQVMIQSDKFPADFGKKSREFMYGKFDQALAAVKKAEADIPAKYWIDVPADRMQAWDELFLGTRLKLRDEVKSYDPMMLKVMAQLRCKQDPARAECAEKKE